MKSLALLTALLTALLACTVAAHASVTETFKQTYPLAADGVVQLENVNGDVDITVSDRPEVSVEAVKRSKDDDSLKLIEIIVDAQPTKLSIKTKYPKHSGWSFFGNNEDLVRYKLVVPVGARLEKIETVNSDITVTGVRGAVRLTTVNGKIVAAGLQADARLESVNGSLHAEFTAMEHVHDVKLESVNGGLEVILPKGASASIKTSSVNGGSSVAQPIKLSHSGSHHLAGDIGSSPGPRIELETVNGGIAVKER